MFACKCPDGDESWLTEICCRQIEASAYIFAAPKKTVVKPSLKKASIIVESVQPQL